MSARGVERQRVSFQWCEPPPHHSCEEGWVDAVLRGRSGLALKWTLRKSVEGEAKQDGTKSLV